MSSRLQPLAQGLEQRDSCGDGNVETIYFAGGGHGNGDEEIAVLAGEPSQSCAFGSHDDAKGPFQIRLVQCLRGIICRPYQPEAQFLQFLETPRQIGDLDEGRVLRSSTRHLARRLREGGGLVFWSNDCQGSRCVRCPQASTQIVGVLHAVEHQNERILCRRQAVIEGLL